MFGNVWFNQEAIANILSLPKVKQLFVVTLDSNNRNIFTVHLLKGQKFFIESKTELYCHKSIEEGSLIPAMATVTTIRENKAKYIKREVRDAAFACWAQDMMRNLPPLDFRAMLRNSSINNCPIKTKT